MPTTIPPETLRAGGTAHASGSDTGYTVHRCRRTGAAALPVVPGLPDFDRPPDDGGQGLLRSTMRGCSAAGRTLSAAAILPHDTLPHDTLDKGRRSAHGSPQARSKAIALGRTGLSPPVAAHLSARPDHGGFPADINGGFPAEPNGGTLSARSPVDSCRRADQRCSASGGPRFQTKEQLPGAGRAGHSWNGVLFALPRAAKSGVLALAWALLLAVPAAHATDHASDLLAFIRHLEAGRAGYNAFERRITVAPPKLLTAMRVGEVLAWQNRVRAAGNPSTAAGGYQIIRATLDRLVRNGTVSKTAIFNADTQDRLARSLIGECGLHTNTVGSSPRRHSVRFANCLAGIWASLPLVSGPRRGLSAHHGVAGNRALTTPKTVLALLAGKPVTFARSSADDGRGNGDGATLSYRAIAKVPEPESLPSRARIGEAMRKARKGGTLTPSVRKWKVDPYAQE